MGKTEKNTIKRPNYILIILSIGLVINVLVAAINFLPAIALDNIHMSFANEYRGNDAAFIGALALLNIISYIYIFIWRMLGFYGLAFTSLFFIAALIIHEAISIEFLVPATSVLSILVFGVKRRKLQLWSRIE